MVVTSALARIVQDAVFEQTSARVFGTRCPGLDSARGGYPGSRSRDWLGSAETWSDKRRKVLKVDAGLLSLAKSVVSISQHCHTVFPV